LIHIALAGGSFVFLAFVILLVLALAWTLYARSARDITPRPSDGAAGEESTAGKLDGEQDAFDTHGTR
jgi:hypothetical protein